MTGDRGAVQLVDVIMMLIVIVGIVVNAPFFYKFIGMVSDEAPPFPSLLLQLTLPLLVIAAILSIGVSARR
jgi:hypothetical protein